MKQKEYIAFSGVIFAIVAVLHLARLIYNMPVAFGMWVVPMWASILGVIVAGFLAWKAKELSR